jgi:hypothetical protein
VIIHISLLLESVQGNGYRARGAADGIRRHVQGDPEFAEVIKIMAENRRKMEAGWTFQAFLAGVAAGTLFGLLTGGVLRYGGPYQTQIAIAFWAFVGGAVGIAAGVVRRLLMKR